MSARQPQYRLTRRGERLLAAVSWLSLLAFSVLLAVVLVAWWMPPSR